MYLLYLVSQRDCMQSFHATSATVTTVPAALLAPAAFNLHGLTAVPVAAPPPKQPGHAGSQLAARDFSALPSLRAEHQSIMKSSAKP